MLNSTLSGPARAAMVFAFAVALHIGPTAGVQAAPFTLEILAVEGQTLDGVELTSLSLPQIDDQGNVAFNANFSGGSGIFVNSQLSVARGEIIDGLSVGSIGEFVLTDNGNLYFLGTGGFGTGIFSPTNNLVASGDTVGGLTVDRISGFDANSSGDLVFEASAITPQNTGVSAVFSASSVIAKEGDVVGSNSLTSVSSPRINNLGEIVFIGRSPSTAFFTPSSRLVGSGDLVGGATLGTLISSYSFNDLGQISFQNDTSLGTALLDLEDLLFLFGGSIAGSDPLDLLSFARNDLGELAVAGFDGFSSDIFSLDERLIDSPVDVGGDLLVALTQIDFNDKGQLAFRAQISGGGNPNVIVRATPAAAPIPEPSTWLLLSTGVALVARLGRCHVLREGRR